MDLLAKFAKSLPDLRGKRVCVGLSGGVDSVVLLHLLTRARESCGLAELFAVHVHHGLSDLADDWWAFCEQICADWGVRLVAERVSVQTKGKGLESAARLARYAVYERLDCDVLALAHHRDDQVETFWLAALRGGGLRALAAMPESRALDNGAVLLRPLLNFGRQDLLNYAAEFGLDFVHDPSNDDGRLLRNWLRGKLLPELVFRLPESGKQVLSAVESLQDELAVLDEIVAADWDFVCVSGQFLRERWLALSAARRRQMLVQFARVHGLGVPRKQSVWDFTRVLSEAESATWGLPRGKAILYRGVLFAWRQDFALDFSGCVWIGDASEFSGCIRAARRDDVMLMKSGRKSVFQVLQEMGVPPFAREFWAVAVDEQGVCMAVANGRSAIEAKLHCEALLIFQAA